MLFCCHSIIRCSCIARSAIKVIFSFSGPLLSRSPGKVVTHLDDGNLAAMLRSTARPEALPLKRACWAKRVRSEAKGKDNAVANVTA